MVSGGTVDELRMCAFVSVDVADEAAAPRGTYEGCQGDMGGRADW